jgi:heme exporter protein C
MSDVQRISDLLVEKPKNSAPEKAKNSASPRALNALTIVTIVSVVFGLYLALGYVGTDLDQGHVQRLFYLHVPSFFGALLAFIVTVVGGIQYLRTRNVKWDALALAGVEVGIALAAVNLVTGSVWARPIWNTWWNWDPRLTADAIMMLTYAAYLLLRAGIENPDTRRRFAAVYGIVAIVTAIITLVIIRVVPTTIHPVVVGPSPVNAEGTFDATPGVVMAILPNMLIWGLLVPVTLMWHRVRLQNFAERVQTLKMQLLSE